MLTKDQAIALAETEFWKEMTPREIAVFQMTEDKPCVPFEVFHEAIEKALGRPVFTHEFGLNLQGLKDELFLGKAPPTFKEILEMIPAEKRLIVSL